MKVAVFISGPKRHLNYVLNTFSSIMREEGINFDFFVHIWTEDIGDKIRNSDFLISDIIKDNNVRSLQIEKPINSYAFESIYGSWTDTHSRVSSMAGMFIGINRLIGTLKGCDDFTSFTHVLRLRTDIAVFSKNFFKNIDLGDNKIYVSKNNRIPPSWVSDHIMLTNVNHFISIWGYENFDKHMQKFSKFARNPEYYLANQINKKKLRIAWTRYEDYHVVYDKVIDSDPEFININMKKLTLSEFYNWKLTEEELNKAKRFNNELSCNYNDYFTLKNSFVRALKKRLKRKKAY